MMEMKEYWEEKFPQLDESCFQGERYYYRSPSAETHLHSHKDSHGNIVWFDPDKAVLATPTQSQPTPPIKGQNASSKKTAKKNIIVS